MIHKTAIDLVPILQAIEAVTTSTLLTPAQREEIIKEIGRALPDQMFCPNSRLTLSILTSIVSTKDGSTTTPPSESTKAPQKPKPSQGPQHKPSGSTAQNTRGTSKVPSNVGNKKE